MSEAVQNRLHNYGVFTPDVIERVAAVAHEQSSFVDYADYFVKLKIPEPQQWNYEDANKYRHGVTVLDIAPVGDDTDPNHAKVVHLPMANPLDDNQVFQMATLYHTEKNTRLIAFGNCSTGQFPGAALTSEDRGKLRQGSLRPLAEPALRYLHEHNITSVDHIGYSLGADVSAEAARYAAFYDQSVARSVHIDPAAVVKRSVLNLGMDFMKSNSALNAYVTDSGMPIFEAARKSKNTVQALPYILSLGRLTNVAVARALAQGGFEQRLDDALGRQETMVSTVIWGSESELAKDGLMKGITERLQRVHDGRFRAIRIEGARHAMANDIHLHAAMALQGRTA